MSHRVSVALGSCLAIGILSGCADVSPASYSVGSVGQVNRAVRGIVISARDVRITGSQTGSGATAGAIAGGAAGSQFGNNAAANVVGVVGGAVAGAMVGGAIEEGSTRQAGVEYVVQTETGAILTLVQGLADRVQVGDHVLVLYGDRSRLIRDPSWQTPH